MDYQINSISYKAILQERRIEIFWERIIEYGEPSEWKAGNILVETGRIDENGNEIPMGRIQITPGNDGGHDRYNRGWYDTSKDAILGLSEQCMSNVASLEKQLTSLEKNLTNARDEFRVVSAGIRDNLELTS